jgi:hypothetical protein
LKVTNPSAGSGGGDIRRQGVTQADVDTANALVISIQNSDAFKQTLIGAHPHDAIFLATTQITVRAGDPEPPIGGAADVLLLPVNVEVTALAVPENVLNQLALHTLGTDEAGGQFIPGSVSASELGNPANVGDDGSVHTQLRISGLFARDITSGGVRDAVKGKSASDAKSTLEERYGIQDADVRLTPGWAPWLPRFGFRIDVDLKSPQQEPSQGGSILASNNGSTATVSAGTGR